MLCFTNSHFKLCQQEHVTVETKMQQELNRTREDHLQITTDKSRQPEEQEMSFRTEKKKNLLHFNIHVVLLMCVVCFFISTFVLINKLLQCVIVSITMVHSGV